MADQLFHLADKTAIVTGGANGIGEQTARLFARLGAQVVIADVDHGRGTALVDAIAGAGGKAAFVATDILSEAQIAALAKGVGERFGAIDIVVNSAGIPRTVAPDYEVAAMVTEHWNTTIAGHLTSTMLMAKYALPIMIAGGGGSIVNVSSLASLDATADLSAYAAAKAGVNQLTKEIAATYGRDNVRCNAVVPGAVLTERGRKTMGREMFELFATETPLPRLATPQDLAHAILFFASELSSMISGQTLTVDGGMMTKLPYWLPKMRASRGAAFDEAAARYSPD